MVTQISAKFKGKDLSLGYKTGQIYDLILSQTKNNPQIEIKRNYKGQGLCIYSNLKTFLQNWEDIKFN